MQFGYMLLRQVAEETIFKHHLSRSADPEKK